MAFNLQQQLLSHQSQLTPIARDSSSADENSGFQLYQVPRNTSLRYVTQAIYMELVITK